MSKLKQRYGVRASLLVWFTLAALVTAGMFFRSVIGVNAQVPPPLLSLPQAPVPVQPQPARQILYNGVVLPNPWPPRYVGISPEGMPVPYLRESPAAVNIVVGRQLFVDDFLIDSSTNMKRTFHVAEYCTNNPVVRPDKPWETDGGKSTALASEGGVWYDQASKLFKMWYSAAGGKAMCFAVSTNGTNWDKPMLDVVKETNIVLPERQRGGTVWMDMFEPNPAQRFKLFRLDDSKRFSIYQSADGLHWGGPVGLSPAVGDAASVQYNPVRKVWMFGLATDTSAGKVQKYVETKSVATGTDWKADDAIWWTGADKFDLLGADTRTQLLSVNVVPYESLMVGLFTLGEAQSVGVPKPNKIEVGFSRDGFHWTRPDRRPFIPYPEKQTDWNWSGLAPSPGNFLVAGRKLQFYVGGRSLNGVGSTGLATLRRDGFASMDAETNGVLTTWPVHFTGKFLFINVDNPQGELKIEILNTNNVVLPQFTREKSVPINIDSTLILANWQDTKDLSSLVGQAVKFRFHLSKGSLYSFWISPTFGGASRGFLAGGGPHFTPPVDMVGTASYRPLPVVSNYVDAAQGK